MDKRKWVKKIGIIIVIIVAFIWLNQTFFKIPPEEIRNWVMSFGWVAPGVYLVVFALRPFILFPSSLLALVGGLAFGFWYGFLLTIIGTTLGALLSYLAVRNLGFSLGKISSSEKYAELRKEIEDKGFIILLILRLIPFLHFELVTYLSAVSNIRMRDYLFATVLGVIPGAFIYCGLGSSSYSGGNELLILSIVSLIVLTSLPILFRKKLFAMFSIRTDEQ
ncbi:TVP38/TMEM64 family protein [Pseudalkalibacillus berkeleyi]|uniref:TVP38/TMEM64 family membrane protein n=1 Tax=Pseudalkalibacillus berkeleyi TaxID=1069813 RepID=A0ABS9GYB9_9BACL|nr:TVP38/TMEM64 family protein [Pseudalkalibacillus berkeleyi]MCF6137679.1 TVP38/TMEM64 family protein [Pseudalkalibacillus berkeleyi]